MKPHPNYVQHIYLRAEDGTVFIEITEEESVLLEYSASSDCEVVPHRPNETFVRLDSIYHQVFDKLAKDEKLRERESYSHIRP
jgi:hypothetical protein